MVTGASGDAAEPRLAGDPFSEFAAALSNACALGSAMLGSMTAQPDLARAAESFAPFIEPFRRAAAGDGGMPGDASMTQDMADAAGFLARTWMVAATSGLRYWRRLAELNGQHQAELMTALSSGAGGLSDDDRRAMLDDLRGYVRELGDVSLQEARLLQHELEKLSVGLAASDDATSDAAPHRRRWRAKP